MILVPQELVDKNISLRDDLTDSTDLRKQYFVPIHPLNPSNPLYYFTRIFFVVPSEYFTMFTPGRSSYCCTPLRL